MITCVEVQQEINKPITVTCDICHTTFEWDSCDAEEFEFIRRIGGYSSVFGDEYSVELDICQHCLKKMIGRYVDEKGLSGSTV